jgi:cystathionine beta-lyase/cystathionine gamma-synthase
MYRPHNAVYLCSDITDWRAQEKIYPLAEQSFGKTVDIVLVVAGILDTSDLINDIEQGTKRKKE